jgi:hypothetical protein
MFLINPFWYKAPIPSGLGYRYGYQSDGVDEGLNFGNVLPLDYDSTFSFSFWIKTTDTTKGILGKFNGTTGYYLYITSAGKLSVRLYNGTLTRIDVYSTNTINNGEWKHCVCTYDGSTNASGVKIYIDAVLESNVVNDDTLGNDTLLNASDLEFASVSSYLNGRLDDVQYYDFVLNSTQASDIYNSGYVTAPTASPIHHWKLGEEDTFSTNWTVKDSVGSLDGTSVNMEEVDRKLGVAYSMAFDGVDEYIDYGDILDLDGLNPFSINLWCYLSANKTLLKKETVSNVGYRLVIDGNSKINFSIGSGSSNRIRIRQTVGGGWTTEFNQLTLTYDGSGLASGFSLYKNSTSESFSALLDSLSNSSNSDDFNIAKATSYGGFVGANYLNGKMMEVSFYDTELSASDVALLFNETGTGNGVPIDPRNVGLSPIFYCPMVGPNDTYDGTNWTITDEIAGNNGTSVNMEEADKTSETP